MQVMKHCNTIDSFLDEIFDVVSAFKIGSLNIYTRYEEESAPIID